MRIFANGCDHIALSIDYLLRLVQKLVLYAGNCVFILSS